MIEEYYGGGLRYKSEFLWVCRNSACDEGHLLYCVKISHLKYVKFGAHTSKIILYTPTSSTSQPKV